jgi:hypothetical protein
MRTTGLGASTQTLSLSLSSYFLLIYKTKTKKKWGARTQPRYITCLQVIWVGGRHFLVCACWPLPGPRLHSPVFIRGPPPSFLPSPHSCPDTRARPALAADATSVADVAAAVAVAGRLLLPLPLHVHTPSHCCHCANTRPPSCWPINSCVHALHWPLFCL